MENAEQILSQRVIALLKGQGIAISDQQVAYLLKQGDSSGELSTNDIQPASTVTSKKSIHGYNVYVEFDALSGEKMSEKQLTIARIIGSVLKIELPIIRHKTYLTLKMRILVF